MIVRDATVDDYDAYAALFPELGVGDPLPSRQRFADELRHRVIVAVDGHGIVGYALVEQFADVGYIRNIVSDRSRRRAGIGRALMEHARARFLSAGTTTWCLNVEPGNVAAIALYTRCGLSLAYHSCALRLPATITLASSPPDLVLADIPAASDAEIEPAFRLLRGQLASARSRPSRRVVQLVRNANVVGANVGGANVGGTNVGGTNVGGTNVGGTNVGGTNVLGIGVFSSSIPGAFPFRLSHASCAGPFLAHLRTLCPPDAAFIQVGVEDDEPLRAAVLALGAHLQLEILHMRGPLAAR